MQVGDRAKSSCVSFERLLRESQHSKLQLRSLQSAVTAIKKQHEDSSKHKHLAQILGYVSEIIAQHSIDAADVSILHSAAPSPDVL